MSKTSSSLYNRLYGIFKTSGTATKISSLGFNQQNLQNLPKRRKTPSSASSSAVAGGNSSVDQKEKKLRKLVEKFKRNSDTVRFRGLHGHYAALVRRLAAAKKFSMINDVLQHQKKYKDIQSEDFVIRILLLYGYAGMAEHAHIMFDEMPELNCERTIKSFNALLSAYVNSRKFDKAEGILRELPEKLGLNPDLVSYNTIIKGFCRLGSLENALSMLDEMEKKGLEPDMITFNTLLEAFYKMGRFLDGEKLWHVMETKNLVPNIRSYNSRMRGFVKAKKISDAVELLGEMETKGIEPDVHTYNALIGEYAREENSDEAMKFYGKLKEKGHSPDTVTCCLLIPLLCKKDHLDMAVQLCEDAIENRVLSRPNMFKPVIAGLVNESRIDKAMELVKLGKLQNYFRYDLNLAIAK